MARCSLRPHTLASGARCAVVLFAIFIHVLDYGQATPNKSCNSSSGDRFEIRYQRMTQLVHTRYWQASHIEDDKANPNGLLISSYSRIMTYDLLTNDAPKTIFGSTNYGFNAYHGVDAEFDDITGFRQIDNATILAVDKNNHCIRLLNRINGRTNAVAGQCQASGRVDGSGKNAARFHSPHFIIDGQYQNEYFITDSNNSAIRIYDHNTSLVGTLVEGIQNPKEMVLNQNRTLIFVTVDQGVAKVNISAQSISFFPNNEKWSAYGITRLPYTSYLLVTHRGGTRVNTVTVFTESGAQHETICDGTYGTTDGQYSTCQTNKPASVSFSYTLQALVIGAHYAIRHLNLTYQQEDETCIIQQENTTLQLRPTVEIRAVSTLTTNEISTTANYGGDDNQTAKMTNSTYSKPITVAPTEKFVMPEEKNDLPFIAGVAGGITFLIVVILILVTKLHRAKSRLRRMRRERNTECQQQRPLPTRPEHSERSGTNHYQSIHPESVTSSDLQTSRPTQDQAVLPPRRVRQLRGQQRENNARNSATSHGSTAHYVRMNQNNRTSQGSSNEAYQHMNNVYNGANELQSMLQRERIRRTQERMALTLIQSDMENDTYNIHTVRSSQVLLQDTVNNNQMTA